MKYPFCFQSACTQTVLMVLIVSALIVGTLGAFNAYKQVTSRKQKRLCILNRLSHTKFVNDFER